MSTTASLAKRQALPFSCGESWQWLSKIFSGWRNGWHAITLAAYVSYLAPIMA